MKKIIFLVGLSLTIVMSWLLSPALAETLNVPGGYATIQAGIDAAADGDVVLVSPGTYAENIDFQGKAITVRSDQGPETSIIDGGGTTNGSIGVMFHSGEGYGSVIEGFTITNCEKAVSYGVPGATGPPYPPSASPVIIKNILYDNHYGIHGYVNYQTEAVEPYIARNIIDANYCGIHLDDHANAYGGVNAIIRNNTIVNNSYCGINLRMHQSLPTINSNIVAGNGTGIEFTYTTLLEERKALVWYNNIWGNDINFSADSSAVDMNGIQGNISADPLFADSNNLDYHLLTGSPSIDTGDPASDYDDLDGTRNDMGGFGGPLDLADTTPPESVTIISASPAPETPTNDNTVKITWETPSDEGFGIDGYSFVWDTNSTTVPDMVKDLRSAITATTSDPLPDGNGHYFHIRAVDRAHNWGPTTHQGPFYIDSSIPVRMIYETTILQPPAGYERSSFYGINASGQAAGKFFNFDPVAEKNIDRQAIVLDPVNGVAILPTLSGQTATWAINDSGQVAGYSFNAEGFQRAVRWDNDGSSFSIHDLGTLYNPEPQPDGQWGNSSEARSINNQGQVTGYADIPNNDGSFIPYHAFLHSEPDGMQDLGTLRTGVPQYQNGYSVGYYISDQGKIVGVAHASYGGEWTLRPFIHDEIAGMKELGINPYYPLNQWSASVINGNGTIGGFVIADADKSYPYYWLDQGVTEPIPVAMPTGFPYGEIYGMNSLGQMVGMMWNDAGLRHAFMLDITHGIQDLNDVTDLDPGEILEAAVEINDSGQIVGNSEIDGQKRGFILNISAPCRGDFDHDGDADGLDLAAYGAGAGNGISLEDFAAAFGRINCSME